MASGISELPAEPRGARIKNENTASKNKIDYFPHDLIRPYSELLDELELNMLSRHRLDSNENLRKKPKTGTMARSNTAQQKLTPRFTPCSTFTLPGFFTCQFCHVPSTRNVYCPAGSDERVASVVLSPSLHDSPSSTPL